MAEDVKLAALAAGRAEAVPIERDTLGRMVREAWVRWAHTQPSPKPSWLVPYDELAESDKEADRQIGEAIAKWTVIHYEARRAGRAEAVAAGWLDDPASDERWNAGLDFGMTQLCSLLGVDTEAVTWDAATETLDGDVRAVLGNILRAKYGDDWGPRSALVSAPAAPIEAERTNIFAYTEPGSDFPAFISINRRGDRIVLTARSRGGQSTVDVDFPEQQLLELSKAFRPAHYGWLFLNPDTGTEWSSNHPVQSGEVDDAEDIRPATLETLHAELIEAWSALADARRGDTPPKEDAAPAAEAEPVAWQWNNLGTWHTVECGPQIDAEKYVRSVAGAHGRVRPIWTAAPPARQDGALREALDLDKAVSTAALTWCGEKDRETFQSDVDYFKHNWRALPGLTAYVDRELGKRARAALAQSAPVKAGG